MGFPLICEECGNEFEGKTLFVRCCSSRCRMRKWRRTEKGKACVVSNNAKVKRPDIKKVCPNCGKLYITSRIGQYLCSCCSQKDVGKKYRGQRWYDTIKHPDISKVCEACGEEFVTAKSKQYLCSKCSRSEYNRKYHKKYRILNPDKIKARAIVTRGIKYKTLKIQPCEVCGEKENPEAHHHDYSKPLDITWLCEKHHNLIPDF